jgi:hypothetical protein
MKKLPILFLALIFLTRCHTTGDKQDSQKAKQLFDEGMKMSRDRITIQDTNIAKAYELNKKAIEKFSAAYDADTSFVDAVLFASECTMFARDYKSCLYWTSKLMRLDTSQHNQGFCMDRIKDCKEHLQ